MLKRYAYFILMMLCYSFNVQAQNPAPQGINYQAIARNAVGNVYVNQNVSLRITDQCQNLWGKLLLWGIEFHARVVTYTNRFSFPRGAKVLF